MERIARAYHALRRRRIPQVLVLYAGGAWVTAQVVGFFVAHYDLSRRLLDVSVYLLALGLVAALVLAWFHGAKGSQRITGTEGALLAALAVAGVAGAWRIGTAAEPPGTRLELAAAPTDLGEGSVAVLPFRHTLRDPDMAWLGQGVADLLATDLAQLPGVRVVSGQRLFDLLRRSGRAESPGGVIPDDVATEIAARAGARLVVRGSILGTREDLVLNAELVRLRTGTVEAGASARGADVFALVERVGAELAAQVVDRGALPTETGRLADVVTADLDAYRAYQEGLQASRRFHLADAAEAFERAVALDSTFPVAWTKLAETRIRLGNTAAALAAFHEAEKYVDRASERDRLLIEAMGGMFSGDLPGAERSLRELVRRYPDDVQGREALHLVLRWQGREDEAAEVLEEGLQVAPEYAPFYNQLAYHHAFLGRHGLADSLVSRYVELEPREPNPWDSRGEIAELAGDLARARRYYRRALEIRPDFYVSLDHIARTYLKEGAPDAAREAVGQYLESGSAETRAEARSLLADLHAWEGDFEEALAGYRSAVAEAERSEVAPEHAARLRLPLLSLQVALGRFEAGQRTLEELRALDPFRLASLTAALDLLGRQGRVDAMRGIREAVLASLERVPVPDPAATRRQLGGLVDGYIAFYEGRPAEAVRHLEVAVRSSAGPGPPSLLPHVLALLQLGRADEALAMAGRMSPRTEDAAQSARLDPVALTVADYVRARALALQGQGGEARRLYRGILDRWGARTEEVWPLADLPERLAALGAAGD